jgi:hypothetical protein
MSWDSDWLDFEVRLYQESLRRRVRAAYHAAQEVLENEYRRGKEKLEQSLKQQRDEEDDLNWGLHKNLVYEDESWLEQREALAAMALTLLASLTKSFLDERKGHLNKTHPPDLKGYGGKGVSQLVKQVREYKARFNVDLEKLDFFETVREIELARNACVHKEGLPTEDYRTQTKMRLSNGLDNINLTPNLLDSLIDELSRFADSLGKGLKKVRQPILIKAAQP